MREDRKSIVFKYTFVFSLQELNNMKDKAYDVSTLLLFQFRIY